MRIAFVGCGYVADFYMNTLSNHRNLQLAGVMDRDPDRASRFAARYSVGVYGTLDALLEDPGIDIVVNLTNPKSHYSISKASLEAGKHVYSEKPLAVVFPEAQELVDLAERKGLYLSGGSMQRPGRMRADNLESPERRQDRARPAGLCRAG